tara:strand:- start:11746 stop:13035 length:1290 start_codon:yes stop_codon:yes gene_type:complete
MTDEEFNQMLAGLPQGAQQPVMRQPSAGSGMDLAFKVPEQRRTIKDRFQNFRAGFAENMTGEKVFTDRERRQQQLLQGTIMDAQSIQKAIQGEDMPKAVDVLVDRMNVLEKLGEDTSDTKMLRDALVGGRPDIVMGEINAFLSSLPQQTIDPKMLTNEGQMVTQRLGGVPTARTVSGFTPEVEDNYRPMSTQELASYSLPADAPYRFNMKTNKPEHMGGATSTTTIRNAASIPTGYRGLYDDDGNLTELEAISGGPAAADQAAIAQAAIDESNRLGAKAARATTIGGIVIEDIGRYRNLVNNQGFFTPITGAAGEIAGRYSGSPAFDARELSTTIGANVQFEALGQMRAESKTGGALGSITQNELRDLRATLGSISAAQSDDQLLYNLERLERLYITVMEKAMSYSEEDRQKYGISAVTSQGSDPLGLF